MRHLIVISNFFEAIFNNMCKDHLNTDDLSATNYTYFDVHDPPLIS